MSSSIAGATVAADADGSPTAAADGVATADADAGAKTGNTPDVVVEPDASDGGADVRARLARSFRFFPRSLSRLNALQQC